MMLAVVRIRGGIRTNQDIRDTMSMLHLTRQNHLVFVPPDTTTRGMLRKVKDYVTWGEADANLIDNVLRQRGRIEGDRPLTDEYIKENSGYATTREFAEALHAHKARFSDLRKVKPVIRLHPPRGGYENTKRAYKTGGSLGYRGKAISELISRMMGPGSAGWIPKKTPGKKMQRSGGA